MGWIVAAAAGLLIAPVVAVSFIAWRSFTPPRVEGEPPPGIAPSRLEEIAFTSSGRALRGWICTPAAAPRGMVLLVHGWGSGAAGMLSWSEFLAAEGWASMAFDMRGHGRSDGGESMVLPRLAEDIEQASVFLDARPDLACLPRAILGHSMGGAALLLALSRGLSCRAAIVSSTFARVETATDYVLRKWLLPPVLFRRVVKAVWSIRLGRSMGALEPERTIRGVRVPLLLTHGTEDPTIALSELRRLEASADPRLTSVLLVPGAAHSDLTAFPAYRTAVLEFLDGRLGGGESGYTRGIVEKSSPS